MSDEYISVLPSIPLSKLISQSAEALDKKKKVTIEAVNSGVSIAVTLAEKLKQHVPGLHQINTFQKEAGPNNSNKLKVLITLSSEVLDPSSKGYQAPIAVEHVTAIPLPTLIATPPTDEDRPPFRRRAQDGAPGARGDRGGRQGDRGGRRGNRRGGNQGGRGGNQGGRGGYQGGRREGGGRNQETEKGERGRTSGGGRRGNDRSGPRIRVVRGEQTQPGENDVLISNRAPVHALVQQVTKKLEESSLVVLKGSGQATSRVVWVAEDVKRAVSGLHQLTTFESRSVNMVVSQGDASESIQSRKVIGLEITLSKNGLAAGPGYQPPQA